MGAGSASIPRDTSERVFTFLADFFQTFERENCNFGFKVGIVLDNLTTINLKPASSFGAASDIFGRSA
jgi:hypothetical protein